MKLGWRKLGAWALVYAFVVVATLALRYEIPEGNVLLIQWVTGFFFGANSLEHFAGKIGVNVKPKAP